MSVIGKLMDNELLKIEAAYKRLIGSEVFLSPYLNEKINNALNGAPLPTAKDWKEYFDVKIEKMNYNELELYYSLSPQQKKDVIEAGALIEYVLFETVKNKIGWGLLTDSGIKEIKNVLKENSSKGLLEVGCGSGYWTKVLSSRLNIDVQGCELNKREDTPRSKYWNALNMSAVDALNKFNDYDVILIWTDPGGVGMDVVNNIKPGRNLIVSGNIEVTGSLEFYKALDLHFDIESHKPALSFSGSNERTYILKKRETPKKEEDNLKIFESQFLSFRSVLSVFAKKIKHK